MLYEVITFIRARNAIERKGISLAKQALTIQYKSFLEKAKQTDFRQWPQLAENISEEPVKRMFEVYYPMSAKLAVMVRNNIVITSYSIHYTKLYE